MTTALSVILARSLNASDFGVFSAFLGLSQALSLTIDVGLATWLLRELSDLWISHPEDLAAAKASALLRGALSVNMRLGAAVAIATGIVGAVAGLSPALVALSVGLMAYVGLIAMATAMEAGLRARRRLRRVVASNLAEKLVLIGAIAGTVILGWGLIGIGVAYPLAGCVRVILDYVFALRGSPAKSGSRSPAFAALVRAAAPFALNSAAFSLVPRLDLPLVALVSTRSAAYFALGWQVYSTVTLLPVIGGSTLYPFLARHSKTISVQRIALGFGLVGLAISVVSVAIIPAVLPAVFGAQYASAVTVTQIMVAAMPLTFYANALMVAAYTAGREHALLRLTLPASLLGSAAVLVGAIAKGTMGAAIGFDLRLVFLTCSLLALTQRPA